MAMIIEYGYEEVYSNGFANDIRYEDGYSNTVW